MTDGNLRAIFQQRLSTWQWNKIETGVISPGLPDSEFCVPYIQHSGWIEFKATKIYSVQIKPLQVAWLMQRSRYNRDAWIAVRRFVIHKSIDELWLMSGDQAMALKNGGLRNITGWMWEGGPSNWNFIEIGEMLSNFTSRAPLWYTVPLIGRELKEWKKLISIKKQP
jgi:hypothetical protein